MLITCSPLLGERAFGSAAEGTLLLTCTAVSALVANAVLARRPRTIAPDTIIWSSTLLLAAALVLSATGHPVLVVVAALTTGVAERPATRRVVGDPAPGVTGTPPQPGLHDRRQPQDHRLRPRRGRRGPARDALTAHRAPDGRGGSTRRGPELPRVRSRPGEQSLSPAVMSSDLRCVTRLV
ncbi:hypothetical protein ACRJ4W_54325 [Streptomyces sp. GLT-R25]